MTEPPDEFQISLRILGNEIIGLRLTSASRARNWAAFGIIATALMLAMFVEALPAIQAIMESK
jgi:hypothetical protein